MNRRIGHAVELYQAGRREEAAEICHEIIGNQPANPDALHLLGMIAQQRGNLATALALVEEALDYKPSAPHFHGGRGAILQRQGRLDEALEAFDRALRIQPDYALAHFNRGIVLQQRGRLEEALDAFDQAVRIQPRLAQAQVNRGVLLERRGRLEEALEAFDRALRINPGYVQAHFNRGVVLERQGRLEEALDAYDQALRAEPDSVGAHINRGAVLERLGRPEQALEAFDQALRIKPDLAQAHFNRGKTLKVLQRFGEAIAAYEEALRIKPDYAEACSGLGVVLQKQGRLEEALAAYGQAVGRKRDHAEAHFGRGIVLQQRGQLEQALEAYDQALLIKPDCVEAQVNRGVILRRQWRLSEALTAYDHALRLDPDNAIAQSNRGSALACQGRFREAFAAYAQALRIDPNCVEAQSNRLFYLNFDPSQDDLALFMAHRDWGHQYEDHPKAFTAYSNPPDADKTLRVGLVSADFGRHPVGYFLEPLLAAGDPASVQLTCYSARVRDDDLTERLKAHAQGWQSAFGLSDAELAETVRADRIDILMDLAGHTAGNRLGCFALRPAPLQVHWAGYCHSVPLMDYSFWDPIQVPDGDERWFVEPVIRLPDLRWCYGPPEYAPRVAEPPVLQRGYITFGSFNNLAKVNEAVIDLWARILQEVPGSRLLLSWPTLGDAHELERFGSLCTARGIPAERLDLRRGGPGPADVLAEYGDIDIALDPFPFSGCLTTCEALWMGVPVVTLPCTRPVSRQSQAFLTALGRTEWVAQDHDDYVHIAADLASDPVRLAKFRRDQRARMAACPVCDGPRFARHFEAALRSIWQSWCARAPDATRNAGERRMKPRNMAETAGKSVRTRVVTMACWLVLATALWSPTPADAQAPVKSLLEMRQDRVVVQQWDLSCGAAALATLLNYQHGDPVSEREIAKSLIAREEYLENPILVRARHGFSLLDLKRYVEQRGYQGIGYGKLDLGDLIERAPIMVPVSFNGYNHFVVFRGMRGNRVLVADPAWGNRTLTFDEFHDAWLTYPEFGRVGFVVADQDGTLPANGLAPRREDFVFLR